MNPRPRYTYPTEYYLKNMIYPLEEIEKDSNDLLSANSGAEDSARSLCLNNLPSKLQLVNDRITSRNEARDDAESQRSMVNEWILKADGKVDGLKAKTVLAEGLAIQLSDGEILGSI